MYFYINLYWLKLVLIYGGLSLSLFYILETFIQNSLGVRNFVWKVKFNQDKWKQFHNFPLKNNLSYIPLFKLLELNTKGFCQVVYQDEDAKIKFKIYSRAFINTYCK